MSTWSRGVCKTNGVSIHYLRTGGAKPPVVLLHGLMGSGECWTPLARALEGDFDVIMLDARGHGHSSTPDHGYRYDDLASDVEHVIRALGLARPILLGHSMGGMTAALVASRAAAPIRALILADPTFLSAERERELRDSDVAAQHRRVLGMPKADLIAQARARHPERSPEIVELQAEARLRTSMRAFDILAPPYPAYRDVAREIGVPTLLVVGDDPVVTLEMASELRDVNPRIRIDEIQNAGHGLPFAQPERLADVVLSFLRDVVRSQRQKSS
jgi:pimeloyl-ACP methyl ester carboxylesterase